MQYFVYLSLSNGKFPNVCFGGLLLQCCIMQSFGPCLCIYFFFVHCSLAVHPNKLLIATGQTAGHDRRDARVSFGMVETNDKVLN